MSAYERASGHCAVAVEASEVQFVLFDELMRPIEDIETPIGSLMRGLEDDAGPQLGADPGQIAAMTCEAMVMGDA